MTGAFQHRSGRVIAVARTALALFFLVAIWLDRTLPAQAVTETYALLGAYVLVALAFALVTWNDWLLECRLAAPAHILDIGVFTALIFGTEGYTSPFFTFFVFLLLSAAIRWGWRETAATAAAVIVLFLLAGFTSDGWGTNQFELRRFVIRSAYLLVISGMLVWFGLNQRPPRTSFGPAPDSEKESIDWPVAEALRYARSRFAAERIVFAWWESEEPGVSVATLARGEIGQTRLPPDAAEAIAALPFGEEPLIFSRAAGRTLTLEQGRRRRIGALGEALDPDFARRFGLDTGLRIPLRGENFGGELFALGVPGLCSDDLRLAQEVGAEIAAAFEQVSLFRMTREGATSRARLGLAHDLHDSVVQFLAGLSMRLEGLRRSAAAGADPGPEIDSLQEALAAEQKELRAFISQLRGGSAGSQQVDLSEALLALTERLARQWQIACRLRSDPPRIEVPARLRHNIRQLVREAVANAVRHGRASEVAVTIVHQGPSLQLDLRDNGIGFPVKGRFGGGDGEIGAVGPWSLHERVRNLGGSLVLQSSASGSTVSIILPAESP